MIKAVLFDFDGVIVNSLPFKACRILQVKPSQALVVGDSRSDMLMGQAAGAKTCLFFPAEKNQARLYCG